MPYKDKEKQKIRRLQYYIENKHKIIKRQQEKRLKNLDFYKTKNTISQFKVRYGIDISFEDFSKRLELFGNQCNICGVKLVNKKLSLDHCHKTNKLRGFLCDKCNIGLGYFNDNSELLLKAVDYLSKYKNE
jgi:hypothetical protein